MRHAWIHGVALALALGCGGDDEGSSSSAGGDGGAGGASGGAGGSSAGSGGSSAGSGGSSAGSGGGGSTPDGDFLEASGSFNGTSFEVSCDLDDPVTSSLTSGQYLGHEQCPGTQVQIQCRVPEEGFAGVSGQLAVNVAIYDSADNYQISLGDTMGQPLNLTFSGTVTDVDLSLDDLVVDSSATGTFSVTWEDDGSGVYGNVSGSFSATCDG